MNNELRDVSIVTMIGQLPSIINFNNDLIEKEFSGLVSSDNKLKIDVSTNNIHAHNGDFDVLSIGGLTISLDYLSQLQSQTFGSSRSYVNENFTNNSENVVYGHNVSITNEEYDMSSFFSTSGKGNITGISCNDLYHSVLYRVIDGLYIPLMVGSTMVNGKMRQIVYHDHIDISGSEKIVQRVYVIIVNGSDNNSIRQYGSASTIILS